MAALGERGFQGLYSLVALASFIPLVWLYAANKHAGPELWRLGELPGLRWIMCVGMGLACTLGLAGLLSPSPVSLLPGKAQVTGVFRITRHPLFMGLGVSTQSRNVGLSRLWPHSPGGA